MCLDHYYLDNKHTCQTTTQNCEVGSKTEDKCEVCRDFFSLDIWNGTCHQILACERFQKNKRKCENSSKYSNTHYFNNFYQALPSSDCKKLRDRLLEGRPVPDLRRYALPKSSRFQVQALHTNGALHPVGRVFRCLQVLRESPVLLYDGECLGVPVVIENCAAYAN